MKRAFTVVVLLNLLVCLKSADGQFASPGDSVGWTKYDYQRDRSQTGWQIWFDNKDGFHVDFMEAHEPFPFPDRGCAYNFNPGGGWFNPLQVNTDKAGFVSLGVKQSNNAAVCAYHMPVTVNLHRSWIAIDDSQGSYNFTEKPVLPQEDFSFIWCKLAVDDQDNFHIVNHSRDWGPCGYYTRSTDDGETWSDRIFIDSLSNHSTGIFADRLNSSGKTIIYWTSMTGEVSNHANDICYKISTDYGSSWGPKTNITNYQITDTIRAYCHVKAIFDVYGNPHIVWAINIFWGGQLYNRSSILHWSPSTGTNSIVGPYHIINFAGDWRLAVDFPNIAVDRENGWLYCVYVINRDSDTSQAGWPNGEIYAKYSTDNGSTWISQSPCDTGVNLTNTPSPNAPPGHCFDEDYPSMHPYVETINGERSLIISFVEDKDAGAVLNGEGTETDNPYHVYVVLCESIIKVEEKSKAPVHMTFNIYPNPSYGTVNIDLPHNIEEIKIFDISGREIKKLKPSPKLKLNLLPAIYFLQVKTQNYTKTEKIIVLK